jgi:endonuclease YncB( thermonuclease family)
VMLDGRTQHPIRIAGIDAPERRQPYSNAAKDNLARLVFNRNVEARCFKRDRYARNVCRVFGDKAGVRESVGARPLQARRDVLP